MTEAEIDDLLRRPTIAKALIYYEAMRKRMGWPYPKDASPELTALAMIHKARLIYPRSTKKMIKESKAWLIEHAMSPEFCSAHHGSVQ